MIFGFGHDPDMAMNTSTLNTSTFKEFEGYAAAIEKAQVELILPKGDGPGWMVGHLDIDGLLLQIGRTPKRNITEGCSDCSGISVYVPLVNAAGLRVNGEWMDEATVHLIGPYAEFCHNIENYIEWCAITVPSNFCTTRGYNPECDLLQAFDRLAPLLRPDDADLARLRCLINRISCAFFIGTPLLVAPALRSQIKVELLDAAQRVMATALPEPAPTVGRRTLNRKQIIRAALERLSAAGANEALGVFDLATAAGVSERTLRTTFQDYFGVSPTCYLKLRRLHQVRAALRAAEPSCTTVTKIATHYGFWELGRFASNYRRLFGEYPSETLGVCRYVR